MEHKKRILIIAPRRGDRGGVVSMVNSLCNSFLQDRFSFLWLETTDDRSFIKNFWALVSAFFKVPWIIIKTDLVHIHTASYNSFRRKMLFMFWCILLHKPYLLHIHGGGFSLFIQKASKPARKMYCWGLRHAAGIITLAEQFDKCIEKVEPRQIIRRIIPNPGNISVCSPHIVNDKVKLILFAGWIEPAKGVFDLIEAFAACGFSSDVQLVLAGKGRLEEAHSEAEKKGISKQVLIYGWQDQQQMKEWYEKADLLVLPSYIEGMPMVLLEAMAYGVPIISTSVGGIPSMLPEIARSFLFTPGDVPALTLLMKNISGNPKLRKQIGLELQHFYLQNFESGIVFKKVSDFYNYLIQSTI